MKWNRFKDKGKVIFVKKSAVNSRFFILRAQHGRNLAGESPECGFKKYCEVGKKAEYELLEAEVTWKQQKAVVTSALSDVALAKLDLATLTGIDPDQDLKIDYDASLQQVPAQFPSELTTLLAKALQQSKKSSEIFWVT